MKPKLAMCNIFADMNDLKGYALDHGFSGIDWSFDLNNIPTKHSEKSDWLGLMSALESLEVRYHCPFYQMDLGHEDPEEATNAEALFQSIIRLVSRVHGKYVTIHIGLGHDSGEPLSWDTTIENLARLVQYGTDHSVTVCLENLAAGWTSRPNLFEKLIRGSGAAVTLDIGHAIVSESVRSQQYTFEDFVSPHPERILNAHVYDKENPGRGHVPPRRLEDVKGRLDILQNIGCEWLVLEVKKVEDLLLTKRVVDEYFSL
jgi:sugar phosphate isomerase/epimerase